jgi:excinuclease UvrABC ATPase subunit
MSQLVNITSTRGISRVVVVTGYTNVDLSTLITDTIVSQSQRLLALTVALHLYGLTRTANHPDMQKIRIIEFFFEKRLHGQFEVEKNF